MFILVFASLVAAALAVAPVWWPGGQCGKSKYPDAGEMNLPPEYGIVGGQEARPYEFPWQVSIRNKSIDKHYCGGSIINERWVVTAAHCVWRKVRRKLSIVAGEHNMSAPSTVRTIHNIALIIVHENYNKTLVINDIAVIKVKVPFNFSQNVTPVCAPDPDNLYAHKKSQVSGWGKTNDSGDYIPDTLRYTTLNITTNAYCNQLHNDITDDMLCAGDNQGMTKRDACANDSGGPLTVKSVNGANGTFSLVGVVSWGTGCADGRPGVYARVGYQAAWITDKITNN